MSDPLTGPELDAIRNRVAHAQNTGRTWAVEDRRRLLSALDGAGAAALRALETNVTYLMEEHGTRQIDIEDLRAVIRDLIPYADPKS